MNLVLHTELQKLIDERVRTGKYATPEDVVAAAIVTLDQQEQWGDFETGELDDLLAEGESSIAQVGTLDGEAAFHRRRERRAGSRKPTQ
jgi:Arc/MetJ-type ribon-helix-helix transcriptional regulator